MALRQVPRAVYRLDALSVLDHQRRDGDGESGQQDDTRDDQQDEPDDHHDPGRDRDQEHPAELPQSPLVAGLHIHGVTDRRLRRAADERCLQDRVGDERDEGRDQRGRDEKPGTARRKDDPGEEMADEAQGDHDHGDDHEQFVGVRPVDLEGRVQDGAEVSLRDRVSADHITGTTHCSPSRCPGSSTRNGLNSSVIGMSW